jgi:hypothetical protein
VPAAFDEHHACACRDKRPLSAPHAILQNAAGSGAADKTRPASMDLRISMNALPSEPKRIRRFRLRLAGQIPRFPNDRKSLEILEAKSLSEILLHYVNWMSRYVAPRPRTVRIEATALNDPRWIALAPNIAAFLEKVRIGADLTPHLSLDVHTRG